MHQYTLCNTAAFERLCVACMPGQSRPFETAIVHCSELIDYLTQCKRRYAHVQTQAHSTINVPFSVPALFTSVCMLYSIGLLGKPLYAMEYGVYFRIKAPDRMLDAQNDALLYAVSMHR